MAAWCAPNAAGETHVVDLTAGSVRLMAALADPTNRLWQRVTLDPQRRGEIRRVLNQYVAHLLGHRPRMHAYLTHLTG